MRISYRSLRSADPHKVWSPRSGESKKYDTKSRSTARGDDDEEEDEDEEDTGGGGGLGGFRPSPSPWWVEMQSEQFSVSPPGVQISPNLF